jgi:8-amino-7-oxononanoate synthase
LLQRAALLRDQLRDGGQRVGNSACQIVPVIIGESRDALVLSRKLRAEGLFVPAIRPPSVPEGTARLRISLTAAHTDEHVRQLVEALRTVCISS